MSKTASTLRALGLGTLFAFAASSVFAADLINIKTRSTGDAYNDMVRNFGAPAAGGEKPVVYSRSTEAAYIDMVRNFGASPKVETKQMVASPDDENRYNELMRTGFPLYSMGRK